MSFSNRHVFHLSFHELIYNSLMDICHHQIYDNLKRHQLQGIKQSQLILLSLQFQYHQLSKAHNKRDLKQSVYTYLLDMLMLHYGIFFFHHHLLHHQFDLSLMNKLLLLLYSILLIQYPFYNDLLGTKQQTDLNMHEFHRQSKNCLCQLQQLKSTQ